MIGKTVLHYKILENLGEGGMGVVYKAEDTKLRREVALKFLPTNALQGEAEKERFVREAQAAAALNHANIAHIYAIEEDGGQVFIAMEYIKGESLSELIHIPLNPPSKSSKGDFSVGGGRNDWAWAKERYLCLHLIVN